MSAPTRVARAGASTGSGRGADPLAGLLGPAVRFASAPITADADALDPAERALVAKAVAKRRREFAQGRVLAHRLLAELGLDAGPLLRDDDRVPGWPAGAVGCISHTRDRCAVAVAARERVGALGLDVEGAAPLEPELRPKICTPGERAWLARRPEPEAGRLAKAFFSVKECVYKACFPVLRERWGFQDVEVALAPDAGRFVAVPKVGRLAGRELAGRVAARDAWWVAALELAPGVLGGSGGGGPR